MARIAQVVCRTEAEGPGRRFALWFQGCPMRCPGCCNPEFLPFQGGSERTLSSLQMEIAESAEQFAIEGITLLGGEPLAHAEDGAALARFCRDRGWSVMVFSGYTIEEARAMRSAHVDELLACTDILVDGPFRRELPDRERRWVGSTNQRIHFLSDRYRCDDPEWRRPNTLEIRMTREEISVNGFPARSAVGLWKRPRMVLPQPAAENRERLMLQPVEEPRELVVRQPAEGENQ